MFLFYIYFYYIYLYTGECHCNEGYTTSDCSVNQDHVPDLFDLPFSSLCDKTVRYCAQFAVFGDLFIAEQNVTCRVTIRNVSPGFAYYSVYM